MVFLKRCKDAQVTLHTPIVVIADVIDDHLDQLLFAGKTLAIIALALQDTPETFHRPIVNAFGHRDILCVIPAFSSL